MKKVRLQRPDHSDRAMIRLQTTAPWVSRDMYQRREEREGDTGQESGHLLGRGREAAESGRQPPHDRPYSGGSHSGGALSPTLGGGPTRVNHRYT